LEEPLDPPLLVRDDDSELQRILDRFQPDRNRGAALLMRLHERRQVDVAERVPRDDEERLALIAGRLLHRARGPEREFLHRVLDPDAERLAVAEVAADRLR